MMKRRMEKKNRNRSLNQESIKMYHPHLVVWIKWKKKARLAKRIIAGLEDSDSNEDEDNSRKKLKKVIPQNPPVVILTDGLGIKTCQGCGNGITKDEQMSPSNMVFRQKGVKAMYNRKYNCIWNKEQNNHYHLSMKCLHEKDQAVKYSDIIMNEKTFESLSREQMKVLNEIGILTFILENKKKTHDKCIR